MNKVIIIGGGASGMAAAYAVMKAGGKAILLEKNEKLGKKIYITGKGRCNLTNASETDEIMKNVVTNPKFLYSALYTFTNRDVMELMEKNGCPVKVERGSRVFPVSDHSSDVIRAWENLIRKMGAEIHLNTRVTEILREDGRVCGVRTGKNEVFSSDAVILCTGGISYPSTGSTGDGHVMAEKLGHTLSENFPALVPLETNEDWVPELSGLSLKNISVTIIGRKKYYQDFGEMLFTHFGVSGPVILSASSVIAKKLASEKELMLFIDLKPALTDSELDARILRDFHDVLNRQFKNALDGLLPQKLIRVVIRESGIPEDKPVNEITKEERARLVHTLKNLPLTIIGTRGFSEAIITQGGVKVRETDPSTMESKLIPGLYFAGELLDIDALTGGYNLQLAWSTGYLAGLSAAEK